MAKHAKRDYRLRELALIVLMGLSFAIGALLLGSLWYFAINVGIPGGGFLHVLAQNENE